ncbi:suppressor of fused domain protein [Clostridium butyricum]|uniref:suppressor of fused domain protein n=1 Tax=Clostridium butyricum TaxID=1492 RepID=UPI00290B9C43|nr:suppressor of fused domain protein [Clostridium butyricum]
MIDYIEKNLGKIDITIGKILSGRGVDIDINLIRPTKEKNYITLATNGMSSYPMRYSEKDNEFKYAELIIKLPSEWKLDEKNFKDEAYLWMANKNY